jgi:hypothetical protein
MASSTITIRVDPAAAKAFSEATAEDQRKMELLLSLRLKELTSSQGKSLKQVLDEIGAEAEARGLTPEILESLMHGH